MSSSGFPKTKREKDAPMDIGDDYGTSTSLLALFDEVRALEIFLCIRLEELFGQFIIAYTSGVHHGLWWEHVLYEGGGANFSLSEGVENLEKFEIFVYSANSRRRHERRSGQLHQQRTLARSLLTARRI